jgi:hypothetical protein
MTRSSVMHDHHGVQIGLKDDCDPAIVEDYYRKRVTWYQQRSSGSAAVSGRDQFDDRSYLVLASDGRQCLGGLRATVRRPGDGTVLPTEHLFRGLDLASLFPGVDLARPHAELSKLVISSGDGPLALTNNIAFDLLNFVLREKNPAPDVAWVLMSCNRRTARLYEALTRRIGLKKHDIAEIPASLIPAAIQEVAKGDASVVLLAHLETHG